MASSGSPGGPSGLNASIQQAMLAATAPKYKPDKPVPKAPKAWQKVLAAIADAGSVYASGLSPAVSPTNAMASILEQQSAHEAVGKENEAARSEAMDISKRQLAELQLRDLMAQRSDQATASNRLAALGESDRRRATDAQARQNAVIQAQNFKAAQAEQDRVMKDTLSKRDTALRERLKNTEISASGAEDKKGHAKFMEKQSEELSKAKQYIIGMKKQVMDSLAGGMDPNEIRSQWEDIRDASMLNGDYREAADVFFATKIEPLLTDEERKRSESQVPEDRVPYPMRTNAP